MTEAAPGLRHHLRLLHRMGLYAIPGWGGGKLLPGTDPRQLALDPPPLAEILAADYSDGLIILCGTESPFGGYVTAIDVDYGPEVWSMRLGGSLIPTWPKGFLYAELGTRNHKSHVFLRTTDRFEGVINLRDRLCSKCEEKKEHAVHGDLVAEIKGLNLSLRSWPSMPPDKPRGYTPLAFALKPALEPPSLTAGQLAEGLADYLSTVIGRAVRVETHRSLPAGTVSAAPEGLARAIEERFAALGIELSTPNSEGWQASKCPLHEDRRASFSVNLRSGGWICHAQCGKGYLPGLAKRMGIDVRPHFRVTRSAAPVKASPRGPHAPVRLMPRAVRF